MLKKDIKLNQVPTIIQAQWFFILDCFKFPYISREMDWKLLINHVITLQQHGGMFVRYERVKFCEQRYVSI